MADEMMNCVRSSRRRSVPTHCDMIALSAYSARQPHQQPNPYSEGLLKPSFSYQ